jgi:hypothetical protein
MKNILSHISKEFAQDACKVSHARLAIRGISLACHTGKGNKAERRLTHAQKRAAIVGPLFK